MTRILLLVPLLLASCFEREEGIGPIGPIPPIEGEQFITGLGIDIRVPHGWDGVWLAAETDRVTEEWIVYWNSREGWQRDVLLHRARLVPVCFYATVEVGNRSGLYVYGSHSCIALYGGFYDSYFGRTLMGVDIWFHEATHALKGAFHPE